MKYIHLIILDNLNQFFSIKGLIEKEITILNIRKINKGFKI
jgi:hypothetical protein